MLIDMLKISPGVHMSITASFCHRRIYATDNICFLGVVMFWVFFVNKDKVDVGAF